MDIAKARVLLAHSDPHEEARLRQALRPCRRVDACRDYPGLVRAMNERAYDLLIMPVAVCGADAETVRAEICARREISCPAMIVLLPNGLARAMRSFYNEGVVCSEGAPAEEKRLLETLGGLSEDDRLLPDWAGEEKVRAVLDRLSIPRTLKGYDLLLRASRLLAKNGLLIGRLKTDVYPACGEGSGEAAERAIRRAIESAWLKGDLETQYRLFGNTIDEAKGKPTNAEFLSRVVETLRMEA